jgi:hypothetical protein
MPGQENGAKKICSLSNKYGSVQTTNQSILIVQATTPPQTFLCSISFSSDHFQLTLLFYITDDKNFVSPGKSGCDPLAKFQPLVEYANSV